MWNIPWRGAVELGSAAEWGCREGSSLLSKVTGDFWCVLPNRAGCWRDLALPTGLGAAATPVNPSSS